MAASRQTTTLISRRAWESPLSPSPRLVQPSTTRPTRSKRRKHTVDEAEGGVAHGAAATPCLVPGAAPRAAAGACLPSPRPLWARQPQPALSSTIATSPRAATGAATGAARVASRGSAAPPRLAELPPLPVWRPKCGRITRTRRRGKPGRDRVRGLTIGTLATTRVTTAGEGRWIAGALVGAAACLGQGRFVARTRERIPN